MLVTPSDLKIDAVSQEGNTGVFTFEPLSKGFGHTLGNALRRVLLTSIRGAAATQVRIKGAKHQFSTIKGVREDTVELGLNFKSIRFKSFSDQPVAVTISKKGPGVVTAKDIECPSDVEVVTPDVHIATLADNKTVFEVELLVEKGYGYSPVEDRETSKLGMILLDALFSPVVNATYEIEPARFGKVTDLDELVLTVETDGSVTPKDAVLEAAKILEELFERIGVWDEELLGAEKTEETSEKSAIPDDILVADLPLPTRTINALKKQGITSLKALAALSEEELSDIKNVGEKSLSEIRKLLETEGLR